MGDHVLFSLPGRTTGINWFYLDYGNGRSDSRQHSIPEALIVEAGFVRTVGVDMDRSEDGSEAGVELICRFLELSYNLNPFRWTLLRHPAHLSTKKKGLRRIRKLNVNPCFYWCRGSGSNRHGL